MRYTVEDKIGFSYTPKVEVVDNGDVHPDHKVMCMTWNAGHAKKIAAALNETDLDAPLQPIFDTSLRSAFTVAGAITGRITRATRDAVSNAMAVIFTTEDDDHTVVYAPATLELQTMVDFARKVLETKINNGELSATAGIRWTADLDHVPSVRSETMSHGDFVAFLVEWVAAS